MTPERAFKIAKREIMLQLPGLPEAAIIPRTNLDGAYVETQHLNLHLYYTGLPQDKWICRIADVEEKQFSIEYVLRLALDMWRDLLNRRIDRLDQYTSPPDLD